MKLFVIAGHNERQPGALAYNGAHEHFYTKEAQRLLAHNHNVIQMEGTVMMDDSDMRLGEVIDYINTNAKRGDYGIDIHFNNNNPRATGVEGFVSPHTTAVNKRIVTLMVNGISRLINVPVRRYVGRRDYKYPAESFLGKLAIIEKTRIPFILIEPVFLNESDLPKYLAKKREIWRLVAEIYKGNIKTFN